MQGLIFGNEQDHELHLQVKIVGDSLHCRLEQNHGDFDKIQQSHHLSRKWCSQFSAAPNPHQQELCKGRICYLREKNPDLSAARNSACVSAQPCSCEYTSPRRKSSLWSLYQIALCSQHKLIFSNHLKASEMSTCKFKTGTSCTVMKLCLSY